MTPTTRRHQHRAAFTLIELLVVMAIIAILVSLLMAGVMRARGLGQQTENGARIQQIHDAIGRCKNDLKLSYIPSQLPPGNSLPGVFRLQPSYTNEAELDVLLRAFPNMNPSATGLPNMTLDANQTLCFFLTGGTVTNYSGFSNNPTAPFTPKSAGTETRKGPWLEINPKLVDASGHLVDVYLTPFAYFAAIEGKADNYGTQTFAGTKPCTSSSKLLNPSGWQIISAGKDKTFGPGGALPAIGSPGGEDDQANFSQYLLGGRLD